MLFWTIAKENSAKFYIFELSTHQCFIKNKFIPPNHKRFIMSKLVSNSSFSFLLLTKVGLFLFLFVFFQMSYAQIGNSFDIGVNIGAISIQSDYGERGDIKSNITGNVGFTTSLVLYKNFYDRNIFWNSRLSWLEDHIKLKAEVSYFKTNLNHYGAYIEGTSQGALLLKAMHGTSSVINFGGAIEHHFLGLSNYSSYRRGRFFSPYFSFGGMVGISNATVTSDLGDYVANPSLLITAYQDNAIHTEQVIVGSAIFGLGTRIKISDRSDFVLDTRWQSYFSDEIDGLSPQLEANKYYDWTYSMTLGLVIAL